MNELSILFVSSYCSREKYEWIRSIRTNVSLDPAQKTFEAMVNGLVAHNCNITCITAIPIGTSNTTQAVFCKSEESAPKIKFVYLGFRIGKIKRMLDLYRNTKKEVNKWLHATKGNDRIVICDSLVAACTAPARRLAQKAKVKTVAYVTDYPSMATNIKKRAPFIKAMLQKLFDLYADHDLKKYDLYILVAEKLKELIGCQENQYLVIEDLISAPSDVNVTKRKDTATFNILYGGALCKRFGINTLVDAMRLIDDERVRLLFYGSGESVPYIEKASETDSRICYCGVVAFAELQEIQRQVDVLINPRPTDEIFSAYSFPSKTLSYMLSGRPVISTRIPGIPSSYEPYIYWVNGDNAITLSEKIKEIIAMPADSLTQKGKIALEFVLREKNSKVQTMKIYNFIKNELNA